MTDFLAYPKCPGSVISFDDEFLPTCVSDEAVFAIGCKVREETVCIYAHYKLLRKDFMKQDQYGNYAIDFCF